MMYQYNPLSEEEFEQYKRKVLDLDLKTATVEEISVLVRRMCDALKITASILPEGQIYYRGVFWEKKPTNISEVSYPPKEFAKINRASVEGEQLFYCSSSKAITFYEVKAKPGDRFIISTWISQIQLMLNNIGYTDQNLKKMGADRLIAFPEPTYTIPNYHLLPNLNERMDFICDLFCQNVPFGQEEIYKLTTAIARLMYQNEARFTETNEMKFHGFHFPSVKTKGNHDNFVFCIPVIDMKLLTLESVEYVEIVSFEENSNAYIYKILDYANEFDNGAILWKDLKSTWTIDSSKEIYFVDTDNVVSIFDDNMNEILPD